MRSAVRGLPSRSRSLSIPYPDQLATSFPPARRSRSARVVAALGAHGHLPVVLGLGFDVHRAKAACAPWAGGLVSDGVLVTNIVGYSAADLVHFVERLGEKGEASRALCHDFEGPSGPLGVLLFAQNPDGVNRGLVLALQLFDGLLQSLEAGVVLTVGDDKQHLLLQPAVRL